METGIFQMPGLMGLFDYMRINDELIEINPFDWSGDQLMGIKEGERIFPDVY